MDLKPDNCKRCSKPLTSQESLLNGLLWCKACQGIDLYQSMVKGYKVRPYQFFRPFIKLK